MFVTEFFPFFANEVLLFIVIIFFWEVDGLYIW